MSQRSPYSSSSPAGAAVVGAVGMPSSTGTRCSMNATWRHEFAPRSPVLSWDIPNRSTRSVAGTPFHCLHATSQALQPMQTEVSVKNPMRGGWSMWPASPATSSSGPNRLHVPCARSTLRSAVLIRSQSLMEPPIPARRRYSST